MTHPKSRSRVLGEEAISSALVVMLRDWRDDYQGWVAHELRRRKYFVGPSEHRRRKAQRAANRRKPK